MLHAAMDEGLPVTETLSISTVPTQPSSPAAAGDRRPSSGSAATATTVRSARECAALQSYENLPWEMRVRR